MQAWFEGGHEAEERAEEELWFPALEASDLLDSGAVGEVGEVGEVNLEVETQGCVFAECNTCGGFAADGSCECERQCSCRECLDVL